jgi:beta-barrel assembly-enhancing protease
MFRPPAASLPLLVVLALSACGPGPAPGAGAADIGLVGEVGQRLTYITDLDQRVARVGYRLMTANAALCPTVRDTAGWQLHAAGQYSAELRPVAEVRFGLDGDLPGLLAVPEDSPAAVAGLRQGDLILSVNGEPLDPGTGGTPPGFEGLDANIRRLDLAMASGPIRITYRRDGVEHAATVTPRRACGYEVQLDPSEELNARANGKRLFVTTALAEFAATDDELAVFLGHELAHHVLGHRAWHEPGTRGRMSQAAAAIDQTAGGAERQADRVGLYLAARAGFDSSVAPDLWRRFGAFNWRVRYPQIGHPSAEARARALQIVQDEIRAKQASGQPLVP